ncbi:uncharacterized protein LOC111086899 [Limulus polyphemus]|uniref:Uncharacterized protein LOC111086899 n=1 Tax=Limulus polyphemus TaxID=6850 RepID=A0ABM1SUN2_LIMPO|nr:uncharacterized protein LOC111086899 [Limulus polyphemus]
MNEEEINHEIQDSNALILNKHPVTVHLTNQEDSSVRIFPAVENAGELMNGTSRFCSDCTREDSQDNQTLSNGKPQFFIEVDASAIASLRAGTQYTLIPIDIPQSKSPSSKHLLHNSCETQEHLNTSLWDYDHLNESRNHISNHLQRSSDDISSPNASSPVLNLTTINVNNEHQNSTKTCQQQTDSTSQGDTDNFIATDKVSHMECDSIQEQTVQFHPQVQENTDNKTEYFTCPIAPLGHSKFSEMSTKLLSPTSKTPNASSCLTMIPTPHAIHQVSQLCGNSVSDSCFTQHSPALLNTQNLVHGSLMGQHGLPVWSPINQVNPCASF